MQPGDPQNVYAQLDIVPPDMLDAIGRARIVITNYHSLMHRETEQISKLNREILGGREGEKRFLETDGEMVRRVARELMQRRDILVLNDEAHHCYRHKTGGDEETLDSEAAWSELNSTVSRPFGRPESGKICVKVINHFGDEVQKVFAV